jgi:predicted AAA+ superfamily ATPase
MQQLINAFYQQLNHVSTDFKRYLYDHILWYNGLIGITGPSGSVKTTLLFQHIKSEESVNPDEVLYVSLDNLWFSNNTLLQFADTFVSKGGKKLYLDEVHCYKDWSRELKNIYDSYPELKIVFTGSSLLELYRGEADLSRRLVSYCLCGMSFREFIGFKYGIEIPVYTLDEITNDHMEISVSIKQKIKPLIAFNEYLRFGYFPYYNEDKGVYHLKLLETLNMIIERDLPAVEHLDYLSVLKVKMLYSMLISLVPFTPNPMKLCKDTGIKPRNLMNYLHYLEKSQAVKILSKYQEENKAITKPGKVFIGNTNYAYALESESLKINGIADAFFVNQLVVNYKIEYSDITDFVVSDKYFFDIGLKNKSRKLSVNPQNFFVLIDNIETGIDHQIPLWMFGLTY